jgi:hypothetical protein
MLAWDDLRERAGVPPQPARRRLLSWVAPDNTAYGAYHALLPRRSASREPATLGLREPLRRSDHAGNRRRFSAIALTATMMLDADMLSAATAGLRVNPSGSRTPAAIGIATLL